MNVDLTTLSTDELADRLRGLSREYDEALGPVQRGLLKIEHIRREMAPLVQELSRRGGPS